MILTSTANLINVLDQLLEQLFDTFCTNEISDTVCQIAGMRATKMHFKAIRYSCSVRQISFQIKFKLINLKRNQAEHEKYTGCPKKNGTGIN